MSKYQKRKQVGKYWLGKRNGSPAFYRCWLEGSRVKMVSLNTTDEAEAEKRLTEFFILQNSVKDAKPAEVQMKDLIIRYWEEVGSRAVSQDAIKTQKNYWLEFIGEKSVSEATSWASQEQFKTILAGKGLAPSSINKVMAVGKAACRLSWKKQELIAVPPFPMLPVGEQEPMGEPISVAEAAKLLPECSGHLRLFILLLMGTMARPGAVLDLQKSQIDFEFDLIDLLGSRKQNKKRRPVVKLPAFLKEELKDLPDGYLVTHKGERVKDCRTAFWKARKRAGIDPRINTYSFRHGLSKFYRSTGNDPWQLQAQLGHKTLGTTDRYATYAPDYLRETCAAIQSFYEAVTRQILDNQAKKSAYENAVLSKENNGERGGTRTLDPMIKSPKP